MIGLVVATFLWDGAALAATAKMTATQGRSLALALTIVAGVLSVATLLALRGSRGDDDGGGGPRPSEPPWWPEFERAFRDYVRGRPQHPRAGRPREPAGRP